MAPEPKRIAKYQDFDEADAGVWSKWMTEKEKLIIIVNIEYRHDGRVTNVRILNVISEEVTDHDPVMVLDWIKKGIITRRKVILKAS